MKKLIYLCILLVCLVMSALSAVEKTDWQNLELRGKVRSVANGYVYQYFSEAGFLDKEESGEKSVITFNIFYNRDQQGRLVYIKDGRMNTYTTLSYNQAGKLAEKKVECSDKSSWSNYTNKYTYNVKGENTLIKVYDPAGKLTSSKEYSYNDKGSIIKAIEYDENNALTGYYEYTYDARQNVIEENHYEAPHTLVGRITNKYDAKDRVIESKDSSYYDGEIWTLNRFTYNTQGDAISYAITYSMDNSTHITKYTYEYDKQGNWISRTTEDQDLESVKTDERTIEYY